MNWMSRRDVLALGLLAALPGTFLSPVTRASPAPGAAAMHTLDQFIAGYCAAMNAPGLTLGLAGADGPIRAASYGYVDIAAKIPVSPGSPWKPISATSSFITC